MKIHQCKWKIYKVYEIFSTNQQHHFGQRMQYGIVFQDGTFAELVAMLENEYNLMMKFFKKIPDAEQITESDKDAIVAFNFFPMIALKICKRLVQC